MRVPEPLLRFLSSWRADAVLAAALIAGVLADMAADGELHGTNNLLELLCGGAVCACLMARQRFPVQSALAAGCLLALASLGNDNDVSALAILPVLLFAYSLGAAVAPRWSVLALAFLFAGLQVAAGPAFNPFLLVGTIGPWALGIVARSNRRIADQLAARGAELETEREVFAAEAVRYERARIARELHDIVAHCISVMVIQASAGQRLATRDPALAGEAFDAIAESVRQAESEISRLVELLGQDAAEPGRDGIVLVDELVARAGAAGLAVSCRFTGSADGLPAATSEAAYRVVQESLTNALKHAPGAPVEVVIAAAGGSVEVSVVNGHVPATASPPAGLHLAGGGHGLAGMRERVAACGGELSAGPVEGGGWRVMARLPIQRATVSPTTVRPTTVLPTTVLPTTGGGPAGGFPPAADASPAG
jgi:signal transduction histidine kinase